MRWFPRFFEEPNTEAEMVAAAEAREREEVTAVAELLWARSWLERAAFARARAFWRVFLLILRPQEEAASDEAALADEKESVSSAESDDDDDDCFYYFQK